MYDNILGQYYDCVFLLPEDQRQQQQLFPASRPPPPPNYISLRQIQLQQDFSSAHNKGNIIRNCSSPSFDGNNNNGDSGVISEQLEDQAARLIRDVNVAVAEGGSAAAAAGRSATTTAIDAQLQLHMQDSSGGDAISVDKNADVDLRGGQDSAAAAAEQIDEKEKIITEETRGGGAGVVNEYAELERLLTTFIYEAAPLNQKKRARL